MEHVFEPDFSHFKECKGLFKQYFSSSWLSKRVKFLANALEISILGNYEIVRSCLGSTLGNWVP